MVRTEEACAKAIAEISAIDREISSLQAKLDARVAKLKAIVEAKAAPLAEKREDLASAVEDFCVANRAELTENHARKFAEFATGRAGWHMGQAKVVIDPTKERLAIAWFEAMQGGGRFLRVKKTLDLRAILKEPEIVTDRGLKNAIKIVPAIESFWIEPVELSLSER
jgi:phage host-nuclease inhibitor protein Gam